MPHRYGGDDNAELTAPHRSWHGPVHLAEAPQQRRARPALCGLQARQ